MPHRARMGVNGFDFTSAEEIRAEIKRFYLASRQVIFALGAIPLDEKAFSPDGQHAIDLSLLYGPSAPTPCGRVERFIVRK